MWQLDVTSRGDGEVDGVDGMLSWMERPLLLRETAREGKGLFSFVLSSDRGWRERNCFKSREQT